MNRSFKRGLLSGVFGAIAFIAGVVYWVYRFTGRVPFPVRRTGEGEAVIALVPPSEVSAHCQQWCVELAPLQATALWLCEEARTMCRSLWGPR